MLFVESFACLFYMYFNQRHCAEQQLQISQLSSNVEELSQSRVQQAQQLAETRTLLQRERSRGRVGGGEGEGEGEGEKERVTEMELKMTRGELERAKDKEKQVRPDHDIYALVVATRSHRRGAHFLREPVNSILCSQ